MGISYALIEEKIFDPVTGRLLNVDLEFYKLPGIGDIGEVVVHLMTGPGFDERGVIGMANLRSSRRVPHSRMRLRTRPECGYRNCR